jgi:uncharacterized protein
MQSLDELRRIIRRIETRYPPRPAPEPAERVLGGEVVDTGEGPLLVVRREYPLAHRHGRFALDGVLRAPLPLLSRLARLDSPLTAPERLLFIDTETTGLAGGTGTYAFLVGVGCIDAGRFVVTQHFMRDLDEEPALLAALMPVLARASAVVTFNGGGFDLPLLETRFVLARRRWPSTMPHLDLMRPARRVWGACLDDCRLVTLERAVLGLAREDDVPGSVIPALYFEYLRRRRPAPLVRVFDHNRDDVLSLAALLGWFAVALADEPGDALTPPEWAGLGRLWEPVDLERALACYRVALAGDLRGELAHGVRLRLAWWEKRAARWDAACTLWEAAVHHPVFDPRPWEELAKYHEHRRRDYAMARTVVESALSRASTLGSASRIVEALSYRLARLARRSDARPGARPRPAPPVRAPE